MSTHLLTRPQLSIRSAGRNRTLRRLLLRLEQSAKGFELASDLAAHRDLAAWLDRCAQERARMLGRVRTMLDSPGHRARDVAGSIHRAYLWFLGAGADHSIVEEALRGETALRTALDGVMNSDPGQAARNHLLAFLRSVEKDAQILRRFRNAYAHGFGTAVREIEAVVGRPTRQSAAAGRSSPVAA